MSWAWRPQAAPQKALVECPLKEIFFETEKEAHGEFESEHPGYCGAQDTFYVGHGRGV